MPADDDAWDQMVRLVRVGVVQGGGAVRTWRTWVGFWRAALRDDELRDKAHTVYRRWRQVVQDVIARGVANCRFGPDEDAAVTTCQGTALIDGTGMPVDLADPGIPFGPEAAGEVVIDAIARLLAPCPERAAHGSICRQAHGAASTPC